jgi:hypothetical protein
MVSGEAPQNDGRSGRESINSEWPMSTLMRIYGPKSDVAACAKSAHERTYAPQQTASLFDHMVGASKQ